MFTSEELDHIRSAAIGDMLGDSKVLDELGPAATVFRLCRELKRVEREANWLAYGYTNAVEMFGLCPLNVDLDKCKEGACTDCMREAAHKVVEKK